MRLMAFLAALSMMLAAAPLAAEQRFEGAQEAGGTVIVVVQTDPARILSAEFEGVAGGGCSWNTITLENWGGPIGVADDRFSVTNADGDVLEGAWDSRDPVHARIEGTIKVRDPVKGCETPPLRWVATAVPSV